MRDDRQSLSDEQFAAKDLLVKYEASMTLTKNGSLQIRLPASENLDETCDKLIAAVKILLNQSGVPSTTRRYVGNESPALTFTALNVAIGLAENRINYPGSSNLLKSRNV